jgi:hypothetical protein
VQVLSTWNTGHMESNIDWVYLYWTFPSQDILLYYIWCGFRTISLAKSVTWYIEYLMYFFQCEETRRLVSIFKKYWRYVSIFKYIDAMLLNLDSDIVRSGPRLHSTCSKQYGCFESCQFRPRSVFFLSWRLNKSAGDFRCLRYYCDKVSIS